MRIHRHLPGSRARHRAVRQPVLQECRCLFWAVLAAAWVIGAAGSLCAQTQSSDGKTTFANKPKSKNRKMDHYRTKLEVTDDAEWSVVQKRIENVLEAEHELQAALAASQRKSRSSKSSGSSAASTGHSEPARSLAGEDDIRALQQSLEGRAPAQEIKPRLARVREMLKLRQEKLANAREDLRAVLSSRQEAIAVLSGLLR